MKDWYDQLVKDYPGLPSAEQNVEFKESLKQASLTDEEATELSMVYEDIPAKEADPDSIINADLSIHSQCCNAQLDEWYLDAYEQKGFIVCPSCGEDSKLAEDYYFES